MKSRKTNLLRKGVLAVALSACLANGAFAQSNSTGTIAGQEAAGDTILIEGQGTGVRREVSTQADGSFRVSSLPTGTYTVTVRHADGTTAPSRTVNVSIGTTSTTTLATVQVTASAINPIDVASVESTTIMTAEQIEKIPVARSITNVALLAPGTVKGDAAFGNLASFGGSSVAENQFFVNGFNITNSFKNLAFGQVPFEAIAEQQVKTGGYGAEFGRSTGGVINLVTKRGTNEFHAGGNVFYTPQSLRSHDPNVYGPGGYNVVTGVIDQSTLGIDNTHDELGTTTTAALWASGALIQDRLFGYALVQHDRTTGVEGFGGVSAANNASSSSKSPTWVVKLDWNISDDHLLELTGFSDTNKFTAKGYNAIPGTNGIGRGALVGTAYTESGGDSYALKYTGYLTDNFTLSALYGSGKSSRSTYGITANGIRQEYDGQVGQPVAGCPVIADVRIGVAAGTVPRISGCGFIGVLGSVLAEDSREQFRIDADWQLGDHQIRFGYDSDKFESFDAESFEGGAQWRYSGNPANPSTLRVRKRVFQTGAGVEVDSTAFYIEDRWQVTDNFLAYGGLRWDTFENLNGAGQAFVKIDNQFGPRFGFSWDVNGDQKLKVFGNAGRYALPLTANVAVRGASISLFSTQSFTYTSVDPVTGIPSGLAPAPGATGVLNYLNNEFGVAKNPLTVASQNLQPMYQDEYIFGFQAQVLDNVSVGVRGIFRKLQRAIDDFCDDRVVHQWAIDNGYGDDYNELNPDHPFCVMYNPGSDLDRLVDVDGDGTLEHVVIGADEVWSADDELVQDGLVAAGVAKLGPKAKRSYKALEIFAEGHWDKFFLQGSYTWSKSFGNTEGGVKSDIGQDDTGATQDFDYPELMIGAEGYLPNDRRHSLKLFGNYEIDENWSIGGNLLVQSGRPINCFGILGFDPVGYGTSYFSCDLTVPDGDGDNGNTIVPRGSAGRMPWSRTLDLNVAYKKKLAGGDLTLKLDMFNVFDEHATTDVSEFGEDGVGNPIVTSTYKVPIGFQDPRSVRFMVQYEF